MLANNKKIIVKKVLGHKKWIEVEVIEGSEEHKDIIIWNRAMNYTIHQDRKELKRQNEREEMELSSDELYEETGYEIPDNDSLSPTEYCEQELLKEAISFAMNQLPEIQRNVVYRVIWEHKSLNAIAKEDGKNPSTVKEAYKSALEKLRPLLKNFENF